MNKIYGIVGLARKARKTVCGYDPTVEYIKSPVHDGIVLIAVDASEKTKKNIKFQCDKYDFEYVEVGEKQRFGVIFNKNEVSVCLVNDYNMISYIKSTVNAEVTE